MTDTKNILITGASSGIGSALAIAYAKSAKSKTRLLLLARNEDKLEAVKDKCNIFDANGDLIVETYSIDVTNTSKLQELVTKIDQQTPIDLIICNAGVSSSIGENGEAESWQDICNVIDTNVYGVLASLNPLISHMQARQSGQIAIISSLGAYKGMPITPVYCASKAAVKSYGEALRGWLKNDNIKVSVICPGFVESNMSSSFPGDKPLMISAEKAAKIIIKGLGKNKANISFPFPLNLGMWFLTALPSDLSDWFFNRFSHGGRR